MAESPFVVAESTLTDRYQTTVPAPIRKALGLGKQDKITYRLTTDGTVELSRAEKHLEEEEYDPVLEKFLEFLDKNIAAHPERLVPITDEWVQKLQNMVKGVDIGDINQPLSGDDD